MPITPTLKSILVFHKWMIHNVSPTIAATTAAMAMTIQVTGQASRAVFKPHWAAVSARVAPVASIRAAPCSPCTTATAASVPLYTKKAAVKTPTKLAIPPKIGPTVPQLSAKNK